MFSSISNYIWGEETAEEQTSVAAPIPETKTPRDQSPEGEDWVLVGETSGPAPGNLGGSLPLPSGSSSPSSASSASSDAGDVEPMEETLPVAARHRAHHPTTIAQHAAKKEFQQVKSAQITKQKTSGKALSSKALSRSNKVAFASVNKKYATRQSFNIKMAGSNKNLKQC
jgi:hypothetical protein